MWSSLRWYSIEILNKGKRIWDDKRILSFLHISFFRTSFWKGNKLWTGTWERWCDDDQAQCWYITSKANREHVEVIKTWDIKMKYKIFGSSYYPFPRTVSFLLSLASQAQCFLNWNLLLKASFSDSVFLNLHNNWKTQIKVSTSLKNKIHIIKSHDLILIFNFREAPLYEFSHNLCWWNCFNRQLLTTH